MKLVGVGIVVALFLLFSRIVYPIPNGIDTVKLENEATRYGLMFVGKWDDAERANVIEAARRVGRAMSIARGENISSYDMFRCFFSINENNPMVLERVLNDPRKVGAEVFTTRLVRVYGLYKNVDGADQKSQRLMVHEFAHTFENRLFEILNIKLPRKVLHWTQINDYQFPMRERGSSVLNGFAGGMDYWQFDLLPDPAEEFADMFVGWVYSTWEDSPEGCAREKFMDTHMKSWISTGCPKNMR